MLNLMNQAKLIWAIEPKGWNGSTSVSKWVCLKNYGMMYVWIQTGAVAVGDAVVSLIQASAVAGTGQKALLFDHYYSDTGTSNLLARVSSTGSEVTLTTANKQWVIPVNPATLDGNPTGSNAAFDCVSVNITAPGGADFWGATYILTDPRNAENVPLTAILD